MRQPSHCLMAGQEAEFLGWNWGWLETSSLTSMTLCLLIASKRVPPAEQQASKHLSGGDAFLFKPAEQHYPDSGPKERTTKPHKCKRTICRWSPSAVEWRTKGRWCLKGLCWTFGPAISPFSHHLSGKNFHKISLASQMLSGCHAVPGVIIVLIANTLQIKGY